MLQADPEYPVSQMEQVEPANPKEQRVQVLELEHYLQFAEILEQAIHCNEDL